MTTYVVAIAYHMMCAFKKQCEATGAGSRARMDASEERMLERSGKDMCCNVRLNEPRGQAGVVVPRTEVEDCVPYRT